MLKLDESLPDVHAVIRSYQEKVGDILTLKVGRIGGLTKTKQVKSLHLQKLLPNIIFKHKVCFVMPHCDFGTIQIKFSVEFLFSVLLQARDLSVSLDRSFDIECGSGLEILTAATVHLAIR